MDFSFSNPKYDFKTLTMSSGYAFSVNSIILTSLTDANDFLFAGKAQSLADETT